MTERLAQHVEARLEVAADGDLRHVDQQHEALVGADSEVVTDLSRHVHRMPEEGHPASLGRVGL
jgi:hypothetical protein